MAGPWHETQKDADTLSTAEPRPVERDHRLKPDLYGGSVRPSDDNVDILYPPVTPWTASLPPTLTRLSRGRTATTTGYLGSRSGPSLLRWCWGSREGGTSTGLLSPPFAPLVWGGHFKNILLLTKNLPSLQNSSWTWNEWQINCQSASDGFFLQVHDSCSHGNFFRRHLVHHSQVGKFKHRWQKSVTCDMCALVTFNIIVYHSQVGKFNHTCETHTFLKVIAVFWNLSTLFNNLVIFNLFSGSFPSLVLHETIPDSLTQLCFCRAGLSETLHVQWKNKKSEI